MYDVHVHKLEETLKAKADECAALRRELAGSREAVDRMHEAWRHDIRALAAARAEAGRLREACTTLRDAIHAELSAEGDKIDECEYVLMDSADIKRFLDALAAPAEDASGEVGP